MFAKSRVQLSVLAVLVSMGLAFAQSESGSASVEGYIFDPSGKVIPNATVRLQSPETGYQRALGSNEQGRYVALAMPVGSYTLEVGAAGFATARQTGLRLEVGRSERLNVTLRVATVTEFEVVTQDSAPVEFESSTGAIISQEAIRRLPIRGRNFTDFAQLAPGIHQENDRFGLVIAGQRSINSNVAVDGADFNDALQGNQRGGNEAVFFFPQTAVREFQVVQSGAGAEVGRTGGGFINVVTKSGANNFHGEAFYFARNKALTSRDAFGRRLDNRQNQFGGSAGGPIQKDRAFFFAGVEQNFLTVPFQVEFQPQAPNVVVPAQLKAFAGEQRGTNNPTAVFGRADFILPQGHSANLHYFFTRMRGENFDFDSLQTQKAITSNYARKGRSNAVKGSFVSILTTRFLNEVRGQWATDNRDETPNSSQSAINITGFGQLGGDPDRPRAFRSSRYQVTDNLSYTAGAHQVRFGFDLNLNEVEQQREPNIQGRYDFRNLAEYSAVQINRYRQTLQGYRPEELTFRGTQRETALFLQDKIALTPSLTINAGVRWEGLWNPQPNRPNPAVPETAYIPNDLRQWQPRVGLAWSPGSHGTVVRIAAGVYNARTPATLFHRVNTDNGIVAVAVDSRIDPQILPLLRFPNPLTTPGLNFRVAPPRIFGFDPTFRNPVSVQTTVGVEQNIARQLSVSAGYLHVSTSHLQRRLDRNLFRPTINATGMPIFPVARPNPNIGRLHINESTARARYDALLLTVTRMISRFTFRAAYTFGRNEDDDSNERNYSFEGTLNPFDLSLERAYSKQDIRHNFSFSSLLDLGRGFHFGAIMLRRSGFPYTAIIGNDTQNDANDDNDRAIINGRIAGRNTFRQPAFFDLDLRLFKNFRLTDNSSFELIAEGFNVTKASNRYFGPDGVSAFGTPAAPVATAGQSLFAPSTARYGGPRQLQLGLRYHF
ncbi:MAG: TonB-dependent receptor [Bryobacteraceae bacterium]